MDLISLLKSSKHTVVYPCAGTDWMAITFTIKEFLESRIHKSDSEYEQIHPDFKNIKFNEPDVVVYIDNNNSIDFYLKYNNFNNILFEDRKTKIEDLKQEKIYTSDTIKFACMHIVRWISKEKPIWSSKELAFREKN